MFCACVPTPVFAFPRGSENHTFTYTRMCPVSYAYQRTCSRKALAFLRARVFSGHERLFPLIVRPESVRKNSSVQARAKQHVTHLHMGG